MFYVFAIMLVIGSPLVVPVVVSAARAVANRRKLAGFPAMARRERLVLRTA
jgi:hypothetical protein